MHIATPDRKELKSESSIERKILEYLANNKRSRDTLRGIAEWWILKQRIVDKAKEVEVALGRLVAEGKLSARTGPDGQVRYYLAKHRVRAIPER